MAPRVDCAEVDVRQASAWPTWGTARDPTPGCPDGNRQSEFEDIVVQARGQRLLSDEHFTVDGTLLDAWADQRFFRCKGQRPTPPDDPSNPTVDFHGERRLNDTHESTTDPDARLFKSGKGKEAKLAYLAEVLMDNRQGLIVDACVVPATGTGEREAAVSLAAS